MKYSFMNSTRQVNLWGKFYIQAEIVFHTNELINSVKFIDAPLCILASKHFTSTIWNSELVMSQSIYIINKNFDLWIMWNGSKNKEI